MNRLKKIFSIFYSSKYSIRDRIFYISLIAGFFASLGTLIGNMANDIHGFPIIVSYISAGTMLVITIYTFWKKNIKVSSILIAISLNFLLFPVVFITSGGLYSGMIIYFVMGLFITTFIFNKYLRFILFGLSLIFYGFVIALSLGSWSRYVVPLNGGQWLFDSILCLAIVSFYIFFVFNVYKDQYEKEKQKADDYSAQLLDQANKDQLTNLYNRRYFDGFMEKLEGNKDYALGMIDIDFFKKFNDTYGHQIGDIVLQLVSDKMKDIINDDGIVARFGGEEFIVVLTNCIENAYDLFLQLKNEIAQIIIPNIENKVTVSVGVAHSNKNISYKELQKIADEKLYLSKKNGRNTVTI